MNLFIFFQKRSNCSRFKIEKKILRRIFRLLYSFDVPAECMPNIHPSVEFVHNGLGVVLNKNVVIEENCRIFHNVTIGERKHVCGGAPHILNTMF